MLPARRELGCLLGDHLSHCVQEALAEGSPDAEAKVEEATAAIERLVRS